MKETRLSIDMEPKEGYVSLDSFVETLQEFRAMLASIERTVAKVPVWRVTELSVASAHATIEAIDNPEAGLAISMIALRGFTALERGEEPPEDFRPALGHVKNLVTTTQRAGIALAIGNSDMVLPVTKNSLEHAERILAENVREGSWGSVEGRLEMVSLRGGLQCNIYDDLADDRVECRIEGDLIEDVRNAFGRRVVATGGLKRDKHGRVRSIKVAQLLTFPTEEELPSIDRITGIAPDITGGLSVKEYVRRLRDEQ